MGKFVSRCMGRAATWGTSSSRSTLFSPSTLSSLAGRVKSSRNSGSFSANCLGSMEVVCCCLLYLVSRQRMSLIMISTGNISKSISSSSYRLLGQTPKPGPRQKVGYRRLQHEL